MAKAQKYIDQLTPEQLEKMTRILRPRNTVYSSRFNDKDLAAWKTAAKRAGVNMTEWMESAANEKLGKSK